MNATTKLKDNLNTFEQYSNEFSATDPAVILRQRKDVRVAYVKKLCDFWRVASRLTKLIKEEGWHYDETDLQELLDKVDDNLDSVEEALQNLQGTHSSVLNTLNKLYQSLEELFSSLSHVEIKLFDDKISRFCPEVIPQERRLQAKETLTGVCM
jgi:uncharacterized membrane-anchored protein YhcB (DUF1043 family)